MREVSGEGAAATSALGAWVGRKERWEAPGAWDKKKRPAEGQAARNA